MHEAALGALLRARDPDTMSFARTFRVTRRTLPHLAAIPRWTTRRPNYAVHVIKRHRRTRAWSRQKA